MNMYWPCLKKSHYLIFGRTMIFYNFCQNSNISLTQPKFTLMLLDLDPPRINKNISLEPKVGLNENQAVDSNLYFDRLSILPMYGPRRVVFMSCERPPYMAISNRPADRPT